MLKLLTQNKTASIGAAAIVTGVVLLLSATTVDTGPVDGDEGSTAQLARMNKKKTLQAVGGSMMSLGVLAQVYDQYTRSKSSGTFSSRSAITSSSEMSPGELRQFQDRVSSAAAKLRRSIAQTTKSSGGSDLSRDLGPRAGEESSAELAARASAQISSFIQNYS